MSTSLLSTWRLVATQISLMEAAVRKQGSCLIKVDGLRGNGDIYTLVFWDKGGEPLFRSDGHDLRAMLGDALQVVGPVTVDPDATKRWDNEAEAFASIDEWARTGFVFCLYINARHKRDGDYLVCLSSGAPGVPGLITEADDLSALLRRALEWLLASTDAS